jgi:dihydropteroate synthase
MMIKIVGILNITPDSFSDGGKYNKLDNSMDRVRQLFSEGADIIDIGAESTRPGAREMGSDEEWERLQPLIYSLREKDYHPHYFSIDTRHAETAKKVYKEWSHEVMISDVSGCHEDEMLSAIQTGTGRIVAGHLPSAAGVSITASHKQRIDNQYIVIKDMLRTYLRLLNKGIDPARIVMDPGLGFGKMKEVNWALLRYFATHTLPFSVMLGYSRKRFLCEQRLDPQYNARVGQRLVSSGLHGGYLRVHDVAAHRTI